MRWLCLDFKMVVKFHSFIESETLIVPLMHTAGLIHSLRCVQCLIFCHENCVLTEGLGSFCFHERKPVE